MQQFQVPQFITVEDRIIGPFTLKQFLYILGAAAIVLVTWFLFHVILFAIIGVPIAALFLAMAFMKINGQPFPTVFSNAMNYYLKPHLYLWQQGKEGPAAPATGPGPRCRAYLPDFFFIFIGFSMTISVLASEKVAPAGTR